MTKPMIHKTIIHLLSGGLDSVTMLYHLHEQGHNIHCLLFDYGQRHVQELICAKIHIQRLNLMFTTMEIPQLRGSSIVDGNGDWVVPNRNAIFLALAVNLANSAGSDTITIGCNASDAEMFPDCRPDFIKAMNAATRAAGYDIEICAPFIDYPKSWVVELARDMGIRQHEVWWCYAGGLKPCGQCPACKKMLGL